MMIGGSTALVTGANRGLGKALVRALLEAGCAKVYAGARDVDGVAPDRVVQPLQVDILINNAGVAGFTPALAAPTMDNARLEIETNYLGTLAMCRAFAPVLARNGGGALVNVLSVVSWFNVPMQGSYCASKAAEWSLTRAVRFELRAQGTLVVAVYAGYIDTDMTSALTLPKTSPDVIAARVLAGIETGSGEILADERAQSVQRELFKDGEAFEANMQKTWNDHVRRQVHERA
jgi:NAD(P)-dependent dehydrogenase (short-subunit alcohol dehydrogenase family)